MRARLAFAPIAILLAACGADDPASVDATSEDLTEGKVAPAENHARDVLSTDLAVDLAARHATATIRIDAGTRTGASFEVGDLAIASVRGLEKPLKWRVEGKRLDVGVPARSPATIVVEYDYRAHGALEGATEGGLTFTWPYFCGNLFPCKSEPADGLRFGLALDGVPAGQTAVYPRTIAADAPSYMLAWAVGDYRETKLGATKAGTRVSVFALPGEEKAAAKGTAHLVAAFEWLESTIGPYAFGSSVGSVSAKWGAGAFGGMEHHPYWHVAHESMGDEETHVHEAAHGWFGDGVRLRCWEDLTLSEGTVTYLAARAIEAVAGQAAGDAVWASYSSRLASVVASEDRKAWPDGCNQIDVLHDLWNDVPYVKGAFFLRAYEAAAGRAAVDRALARFYRERRGTAASVADLLDTLEIEAGVDARPLAKAWLQSLGTPGM